MNLSRILIGGGIVLLGTSLLLDQLGINSGLGRLWPLLIVTIGLYMIIKNTKNILPGFFVLTVGILLQLSSLNILPFSIWELWPLFIIFAGFSILFGRQNKTNSSTDDGFINSNAVFWGDEKRVVGEFKGASINVAFGGSKLDLRDAKISNRVVIDINLMFGGVELIVPDNVRVVNKGVGIFGAFTEESKKVQSDNLKTIEITGSALFGGVEIK